jgi:hypothetical protein
MQVPFAREADVMDPELPAWNERVNEHAGEPEFEEGGDPVCWAHLVCPECGAIVSEGHRAGCAEARAASGQVPDLARPDSEE